MRQHRNISRIQCTIERRPSLTSSAVSAASASDCIGPACTPSPCASPISSPAPSSPGIGRTCRAIPTSDPSVPPGSLPTASPGPTSSAAGSRVRTSASPGGVPGSRVLAQDYGPIWPGSSASADRVGWWLRMSLAFESGARTACCPTWRRSVTPAGHAWWVLPMPARPIAGHGCGWWPKPFLPTPVARDWKAGSVAQRSRRRSCQLNDAMGGHLHPGTAEWMMGYPPGWTDGPGSRRSVTPSYPAARP